MKQNLKTTIKLILSAIALLLLLTLLRERYEEAPAGPRETEEAPAGSKEAEEQDERSDGGLHREPYIVYGTDPERMENEPADSSQTGEPAPGAVSDAPDQTASCRLSDPDLEQDASCRFSDLDPDREIRVLLSNPAGGYFFDTVEIRLKDRTYSFAKKDILKRGIVRIQAGDERIEFLQRKGKGCPARYPGSFLLRCGGQGIYVVNCLPLEEYLTLVVPGEMPAGYGEEALKSQAVLARTYAVRCMLWPALPEYGADLDDTTRFQVYAAGGAEPSTSKAVEDTAGSILCDGESVADVYYFSTSCGQTTTTAAWDQPVKRDQPAEQDQPAKQDQPGASGTSVYVGRGQAAFTAEELRGEQAFKTFIESRPADHFEKDVPWYRWEYRSQADSRELFLRIRERYALQPAQILSRPAGERAFTSGHLTDPGKIRDIRVTERSPGGCASELTVIGTEGDIKIRTEYSIRYVLCDTVSKAVLQDGSVRRMDTILPSAFFTIKTGKDRQDVIGYTLVGGGYGHGIGMSQNGAQAMAEEGYDHRQIIAFFYPAYQLEQLQRIG